ncbi:hypothetical protein HN51_011802 [Arachis hypogaea]|uniref:Btz domain-containing protein n=1 Tax=Arachis hypogaea TaxID=3818 RepID=A0A445DXF8_ARAHY|nr:protein MLN51 homolog [Arachis hypogaea]QHO57171.1 uncharacterized protein DS421_3g79950 [Arachis hypogaea]RYR67878.1 hypothetical protein Ahy_A03g014334 [Arachis hypogaea]
MADDSEQTKSIEYESDADGVSAPWWMARRIEASDDEDQEYSHDGLTEKCRPCFAQLHPPNESDGGGEGSPDWYQELGEKVVFEEELEEMSQGDEEELQETLHRVTKKKEKETTVRDDAYVPTHGSFYMHDDRFLSPRRRYRTRRGIVTGMKLWANCTDEPRWKHDKFEDMKDNSPPKSNDQQQRKNQTKGQRYMKTNQFGSLDNYGNQNNQTLRIFKGRGRKKYKPIMKCNNLNSSSKDQIHEKFKESASTSSSSREYRASAKILPTNTSGETLHQTTSLLLLPGIHHGGLPCGTVDDHALITLTGYTPQYSVN